MKKTSFPSIGRAWVWLLLGTTFRAAAVAAPPTIVGGDRDLEVRAGDQVTLSTQVIGTPAPTLQWYRGASGDTSQPIAGAAASSLALVAPAVTERVWLRATNAEGVADSPVFRIIPWTNDGGLLWTTRLRKLGNTFVAVGGDTVRTSADGISWSNGVDFSLSGSYLRDVAFGAGVYVVAGERRMFSSSDLKVWTERNRPPAGNYTGTFGIAWGNGLFVVVGLSNSVSANGIDWQPFSVPTGVFLMGVAYDGTRFVAVGYLKTGDPAQNYVGVVFTSVDGVSWTRRAADVLSESVNNAQSGLESVEFVGGKFIATSTRGYVLVSADGISWQRRDLGVLFRGTPRTATYANGRYIVGTDSHGYFTSPDTLVWRAEAGPVGMSAATLLTAGSQTFAAGSHSMYVSADTRNWSLRFGRPEASAFFSAFTFGRGRYLGINRLGTYTSEDGLAWQFLNREVVLDYAAPNQLVSLPDRFVLADAGIGSLLVSPDGDRWTRQPIPGVTAMVTNVARAGPRLFASGPGVIASSLDGTTWSIQPNANAALLRRIAYNGDRYIGFGSDNNGGGVKGTSLDGVNWTTEPFTDRSVGDVAFGLNMFVAVGSANSTSYIATSPDGQTWTTRIVPVGGTGLRSVHFVGDRFLAKGPGELCYSRDGVVWKRLALESEEIVAVGNGVVLSSSSFYNEIWRRAPDGITTAVESLAASAPVSPGGVVQLSVVAAGTGLSYQWYRGNTGDTSQPVAGATQSTYTTPALSVSAAYWVRVSGNGGVADSRAITAAVTSPPIIVQQPVSYDLPGFSGDAVVVEVGARGAPELHYQWYRGYPGDTLNPVVGAIGPSLVCRFDRSERFWVRVSNDLGQVDSAATLITCWDEFIIYADALWDFASAGLAVGQGKYVVTGVRMFPGPFGGVVVSTTDGFAWNVTSALRFGPVVFGQNRFVTVPLAPASQVYASSDGITWGAVTLPPTTARFTDVFFEGGKFMAVGENGTLAVSGDGLTWTLRTLGTGRLWGVAHGNGRWVVSGAAGRAFHSADGDNWTSVDLPTTSNLIGVGFGAGQFIMVTADSAGFVSSNGAAWSSIVIRQSDGRPLPAFRSLSYTDGRFAALTAETFPIPFASDDGRTWWPSAVGRALKQGDGYVGVTITAVGSLSPTGVPGSALGAGGTFYVSRPGPGLPRITAQSGNQNVISGTTITLSITASGAVSYQWQRNGVDIAGATGPNLVLTNVQPADAGTYLVIITNAEGRVSSVPVTVAVAPPIAPRIVTQPASRAVPVGSSVTFATSVTGTTPLSFQWYKDGASVAGATESTLVLANVQLGAAGTYHVVISNAAGAVTSAGASLSLSPAGVSATHTLAGVGYDAGGTVTITNTFTYAGSAPALRWQVLIPAGWSYVASANAGGGTSPAPGASDLAEWSWTSAPASPFTFTFTLAVPLTAPNLQELAALVTVQLAGDPSQFLAQPDPLMLGRRHSADANGDGRLSLLELTRVIELYNTRNGSTRTGCYRIDAAGEDGFAIEPARAASATVTLAVHHSADSNRDGKLSLLELTRVIELYNYRNGTTRTGQYRTQSGTEDGFAPGTLN